jgi:hypothetical protein
MKEIEIRIMIDPNVGKFTEIDPTTVEGKLNEFCSELDRMKLGFITAEMNVDGKSWSRNE